MVARSNLVIVVAVNLSDDDGLVLIAQGSAASRATLSTHCVGPTRDAALSEAGFVLHSTATHRKRH